MPDLSLNDKKELLEIARKAISAFLRDNNLSSLKNKNSSFDLKRAVFVTLKIEGDLRGCIGSFDAEQTLFHNVTRMAIAAAFKDPRFKPVDEPELNQLQIEISVLGDLIKMNQLNELIIGKHGIKVFYEGKSGTYLPDVATSQQWSPEEFILNCVQEKADKTPGKVEDVEVFLYEVDKFSEEII